MAAHRRFPLIRGIPRQYPLPKEFSTSSSSALATSGENLPSKPIDFSVSAKIEGEESQIAKVKLRPGEVLRAESGAMLYMTDGVEMNTSSSLQGGFKRLMTGQNLFFSDFSYPRETGEGEVGLGTELPSKIVRLSLEDYDSTLICQRGAYMASNPSVDIEMAYTKSLTSGFFGGQGFILQKLSGTGDVLVKAGGTLVVKDLDEGETIRVTTGSIVAFTSTVDYDVQMMKGIKNVMFGEGLFVATLKGPGRIWLQGMPADRMVAEIARRVPSGGIGLGVPIGVGGGGGGGEGGGEGGEVAGVDSEGASVGSGEEMVAATDAAVESDRQATVASSGMMDGEGGFIDSESPSALFGDAVSEKQEAPASTSPTDPFGDTSSTETTFTDDDTTFQDDTSFSTDDTFSAEKFGDEQQDMSEDSPTEIFESGGTEEASDAGSGILGTLWDLFTGGDD